MIKINLATRKQATLNSGGKAKLDIDLGGIIKDPLIRRTLLTIAVCVGGYYLVDDQKQQLLQSAMAQAEALRAEGVRLTQEAEKLQEYEALKKALANDEQVIRTKLDVLRKLVADRAVPPKLLVTLSEAMADDTWLTDFKIEGSEMTISGGAADFNQISDVIRRLSESTYFEDVTLKDSEQTLDRGSTVALFALSAKRRK